MRREVRCLQCNGKLIEMQDDERHYWRVCLRCGAKVQMEDGYRVRAAARKRKS